MYQKPKKIETYKVENISLDDIPKFIICGLNSAFN